MVLEKAPKSPAIFGTAEPGEAIFAEIIKPDTDANPDISSMVADEEGNFFLQLPPQVRKPKHFVPAPGIEPGPAGWEPAILTTRPCRSAAGESIFNHFWTF